MVRFINGFKIGYQVPGRFQRVVLNCVISFFVDVLSGLPLGLDAGAIVIYYLYLDKGLINRILKFVDDTKLFCFVLMEMMFESME